ncbi:MAG: hypothetical protein AB1626_01680 [Candidatus Micrarchaeota archaeon]
MAWYETEKGIYKKMTGSSPLAPRDVKTAVLNIGTQVAGVALAGALSGGVTLPAAMVAANGLRRIDESTVSMLPARRTRDMVDRALVGNLTPRDVVLSKQTRQTLDRVFGSHDVFHIWQTHGPAAADSLAVRRKYTLRSQQDPTVPASERTVGERAYSEAVSALGIVALHDWARNRVVPRMGGPVAGASHYKTIKAMTPRRRTEFWRILDTELTPEEKEIYHNLWVTKMQSGAQFSGSMSKMIGGFLAIGAASWLEGKFGVSAHTHQISLQHNLDQLSAAAQDFHNAADAVRGLEVSATGAKAPVLTGMEVKLQGIVGRVDPELVARIDASAGQLASHAALQSPANMGLLVQSLHMQGVPVDVALGYALNKAGPEAVATYLNHAANHLEGITATLSHGGVLTPAQFAALPAAFVPLIASYSRKGFPAWPRPPEAGGPYGMPYGARPYGVAGGGPYGAPEAPEGVPRPPAKPPSRKPVEEKPEPPAEERPPAAEGREITLRDFLWDLARNHHLQQADTSTLPALGKVNASQQEQRLAELLDGSLRFMHTIHPSVRQHSIELFFNKAGGAETHEQFVANMKAAVNLSVGEDPEQYLDQHHFKGELHDRHKIVSIVNLHQLRDNKETLLPQEQRDAFAFHYLAKLLNNALPEERTAFVNFMLDHAQDSHDELKRALRTKLKIAPA